MNLHDVSIASLDGTPGTLRDLTGGRPTLLVNVASECGLTPQYDGLQRLHERYGPQGLAVVGVPCNQFGSQEPGDAETIRDFTRETYGVTFPLTEKVEVNGADRHDLYKDVAAFEDADDYAGDIRWNFEKAIVDSDGTVVGRFDPKIEPSDERLTTAIEQALTPDPS